MPHKRGLTAFQMLCKLFSNALQTLCKLLTNTWKGFQTLSNPLQTPVKWFAKRVKRFSNPLQMLLKPFSNASQTLCKRFANPVQTLLLRAGGTSPQGIKHV